MKIAISFPIKNEVFVSNPFPIEKGLKSYFIEVKDDVAKSISVTWSGLPISLAQTIEKHDQGDVKLTIHDNQSGQYVTLAEHDLRAWQSILSAYVIVDIDFDNPKSTFLPEGKDEFEKIKIFSFSSARYRPRSRGTEAFENFGRAFLAIEEGKTQIEVMSHYREAMLAQRVGRSIDAYNNYFLYLESQFCVGQSNTKRVVALLAGNSEFCNALTAAAKEFKVDRRAKPLRFNTIDQIAVNPKRLITEIVELRGALRHHSLGNPNRWNPNDQEDYSTEAVFLGAVCLWIAFPKTMHVTWNTPYPEQFLQQAKKGNFIVELTVSVTIRVGESAEEKQFEMTFPQIGLDTRLAMAALQRIIETVEEKVPGAEIFAIRAAHKSKGTELFRYDVGHTLHR